MALNTVEVSKETINGLVRDTTFILPKDVKSLIDMAIENETSVRGKLILSQIVENYNIAEREKLPLCQDTGAFEFWIKEKGDFRVAGDFERVVCEAVSECTEVLGLRASIAYPPVGIRRNTENNTPVTINRSFLERGSGIEISAMAKGGGSENSTLLIYELPSSSLEDIIGRLIDKVLLKIPFACPPVFISICIGGNGASAIHASREALVKTFEEETQDSACLEIEKKLLDTINSSGIGPAGLGGLTTALGVRVNMLPCHIATLPIAVTINCHSLRRATMFID